MKTKLLIFILSLIGFMSQAQTNKTYDKTITAIIKDFSEACGEDAGDAIFCLTDEAGTSIKERFTCTYDNNTWRVQPQDLINQDWILNAKYKNKKATLFCTKHSGGAGWVVEKVEFFDMENKPSQVMTKKDSLNIAFEKKYPILKTEMQKLDSKNAAPNNPATIASKYISVGKKGDYKGLLQLFATKEKLEELKDIQFEGKGSKYTTRHLVRFVDGMNKIIKENTPDGAKNEIAKVFLTQFSEDKVKILNPPIVFYTSATECIVAIATYKKNQFYYISEVKIDGKWKIINADDKPGIEMTNEMELDCSNYFQKRKTEIIK